MDRSDPEYPFGGKQSAVACGLVACTFFYFLLFAQFALLHRIEELDAAKAWLQPVMLLMGVGGLLGSYLAWRLFSLRSLTRLLGSSFAFCSLLAFAAGALERIEFYLGIGFFVGFFLGLLTVVVVPSLRLLVGGRRIGVVTGLGTGLAYFASNIPWLFQQSAEAQCWVAGGVGLLGVLVTFFLPQQWNAELLEGETASSRSSDRLAWLVLVFFALVWLDSAAFYAIQETDGMRDQTWGTPSHLWGNAVVHLAFGLLSGWALDKGFLKSVLGGAMLFLVAGCLWLKIGYGDLPWFGASLYVAGVSLYSTGLVAVIAMRGNRVASWDMPKAAALLLGVAGWIGSGMGIGMARDLGTVPYAFLAAASLVAVVALGGIGRSEREGAV